MKHDNKTWLALLKIKGPIICSGCNQKVIIKNVIEKRGHYLLLNGIEEGAEYGINGVYFIYDLKTNKIMLPGSLNTKYKYWPVKEYEYKE